MTSDKAASRRFQIGDCVATVVSDGVIAFPSVASEFPRQSTREVQALLDSCLSASAPGASALNCLMLDGGGRRLLIDAGMGASARLGDGAGRLLENLAAAGVGRADIDGVLLTHLHCDHLWGVIDANGAPAFPNAELFAPRADFEVWTGPGCASLPQEEVATTQRCLTAYAARLRLLDGDTEIAAGVRAIPTPGHTIGHTSYMIASAAKRALVIGDLCHHGAVQFARPDWLFRWDDDAELAATTRRRIFDMAADEDLTVVGYHLPFPGVGRIARDAGGFRFVSAAEREETAIPRPRAAARVHRW
jgi:glyoxylase-like metal-dependent hydrolase (beta-lactamase superfamily II)